MKIRTGFVSNSSSSSYILAIKEGISKNEKREIFDNYIKERYDELSKDDYVAEDDTLAEEQVIEEIFNTTGNKIMKLDNWYVSAGNASNEDGDFISMLFYMLSEINTPKFKFKLTG